MNNKYQEALNKIKIKLTTVEYLQPLQATNKPTTFQEAFERAEGIEMTIECDEELKTLQKLVNKETPKEVIKFTSEITNSEEAYTFYTCPSCRKYLYINQKYCDNCGVEIDWSEENGNNN